MQMVSLHALTALLCVCCRELYTEKEVIAEERRARWENSPMGRFTYDYLLQALDNPYRRPVIGEAACLQQPGLSQS
jgi:predicted Zn-dependent peptidase